ncbi:hypothetical protein [Streptoalloteichus hindustanus]|uniref:Uncharacterized protein n=1 Tax=Streptoalloteichus hindustanus TaxID=2017 RepID=A0A1M5IZN5_STRHI|nr:hypothetical protein [Streptoalloteichus hindustanus]SHG33772.1 hypothetical protein SAMN05444320_10873 [Streptoalloteichus hindustanus]
MRGRDRLLLAVLVADAIVLAGLELLFLPLRVADLVPSGAPGWLPASVVSWPLPVSAVVALLTTPWLVRTAASLRPSLGVAGLPLLGWVLAVAVIGFAGPGGDVVVVNDWRTLLMFAGGALPAAVALGGQLGRPVPARPSGGASPTPSPSPGNAGGTGSKGNTGSTGNTGRAAKKDRG